MADTSVRNYNSLTTETSQIRDVSTRIATLDEDLTAIMTLTVNSKRVVPVDNPKFEWFENTDVGMIGTTGATAYASNATGVFVTDVTLFSVNDVVMTTRAAGTNSALEELLLVTAIAGTTNGTLTCTRAFGGSTADTIGTASNLKILGTSNTEAGAIQSPRTPARVPKVSGAQIFEQNVQVTKVADSTKVYDQRQERARQQFFAMRRAKMEIENVGLFGGYSETLSGTASRYTSMGIRSIISTNVTDAGTTLTYQTFLQFSRKAFQHPYGSSNEKLLIAAPIIKEALDYTAGNKQLVQPNIKLFGVSLKQFVTSNGTWNLANNYNMDAGLADEAIGIDLSCVEWCPLRGNDTKLITNFDTTNPKVIKDQIMTIGGWRIWYEARQSRLYDVTAY